MEKKELEPIISPSVMRSSAERISGLSVRSFRSLSTWAIAVERTRRCSWKTSFSRTMTSIFSRAMAVTEKGESVISDFSPNESPTPR